MTSVPLLVGLTGGTGSGKSTLARALGECGARVIDADRLARDVVEPGTPGLAAIVDEFGTEVLDDSGSLRRAHLAGIVFADPARLRALEAITHPLIERRTTEFIANAGRGEIVVHDMPLIVERGTAASYHLVLVVDAPPDVRVARLAERGMAVDDARRRIAAQASTEQRRAVADVWFDNLGSPGELAAAGRRVWESRLQVYADNLGHGRPAARPAPVVERPDPAWPGDSTRVAARLRHALGPEVDMKVAVPQRFPAENRLVVTLGSPVRSELLARCGFFGDGEGRYAGADPGLAVDVVPA